MDPAMLALARRHDPRPHKDYWGRVRGWEKLDLHRIPRLGDRDADFEEARIINGFKAASPLARGAVAALHADRRRRRSATRPCTA
jgi:spore germination cell wall hydrolase CwlJ-like protein